MEQIKVAIRLTLPDGKKRIEMWEGPTKRWALFQARAKYKGQNIDVQFADGEPA